MAPLNLPSSNRNLTIKMKIKSVSYLDGDSAIINELSNHLDDFFESKRYESSLDIIYFIVVVNIIDNEEIAACTEFIFKQLIRNLLFFSSILKSFGAVAINLRILVKVPL